MAKSSLKVVLLSVLAAGAVGAATLEEDFRNPPREAGLWAWWHWQGNNVTRKGITFDLEAMRDSGLAGATIFTIAEHAGLGVLSNRVNKVMAYRNEEWWGLIAFAVAEAERLGLKIGMHNSPGFSVTGGPWIDPAHAMQKVTWTRRAVAGGERLKGAALQQPWACLGFYRDIAVVAVSGRGSGSRIGRPRPDERLPRRCPQLAGPRRPQLDGLPFWLYADRAADAPRAGRNPKNLP